MEPDVKSWRVLTAVALGSSLVVGVWADFFLAGVVLGAWLVPLGAARLGGARSAPPALALFGGSVSIPLTLLAMAQIPGLRARVGFAVVALVCWAVCVAAGVLLRDRPRAAGRVMAGSAAVGGVAGIGYFNDWFPLMPAAFWLPGAAVSVLAPREGRLPKLPAWLILAAITLILSVAVVVGSLGRPVPVLAESEAAVVPLGWPVPFIVQDQARFASLLSYPRYGRVANPGEYSTRVLWGEFALDVGIVFGTVFLSLGGLITLASPGLGYRARLRTRRTDRA